MKQSDDKNVDLKSNPRSKSPVAVIFFTVFLYLVGFGMIIPIIPILSRDFGATSFQTGLLIAIYSFMQFVFSPFWGKLSDLHGRKPILLGCLIGEVGAYVLFAFARNLEVLFFARALAGFFGASISTASAYISDITPRNERSKGLALIGAAFGLGFVVGPAIGGGLTYLGEKISNAPFYASTFSTLIVAGLCFCNFLFGLKFLKESLTVEDRKNRTNEHHRKGRLNLISQYVLKKTLGPLLSVYFMMSLSMAAMEATLVLFMAHRFQWGLKEVSFGFAYIGVIIVITQGFLVRRLIPKIGERKTLRIGLVATALGFAGIGLAHDLTFMCITMTVLALGNGLSNPATLGGVSLLTGEEEQGVALGVAQSLSALGRILGPAIGGQIYATVDVTAPFWFSTVVATIGFLVVILIFNRLPEIGKRSA